MAFTLIKSKENVCRERAQRVVNELYLDEFNRLRNTDFPKAMMLMKKMKLEEEEHFISFLKNYVIADDALTSFDASSSKSLKDFNKMLIDYLDDI